EGRRERLKLGRENVPYLPPAEDPELRRESIDDLPGATRQQERRGAVDRLLGPLEVERRLESLGRQKRLLRVPAPAREPRACHGPHRRGGGRVGSTPVDRRARWPAASRGGDDRA